MITKEQKITKYCCLYASDFHLEMILLPYIKNKIYKSKIIVFTEENLKDSLKILLERTNLKIEDKNEILNIKSWNTHKFKEEYNKNEEYTIIINGKNEYRNKIYEKFKNIQLTKLNFIDCFNINQFNINKQNLQEKYDKFLNTEAF